MTLNQHPRDSRPLTWELNRFYDENFQTRDLESVILLNYTNVSRLEDYWKVKGLRLCVDGGCNRLVETKLVPDIILGDFDSISKKSIDHYHQLGVQMMKIEDQDSTDFSKALNYVLKDESEKNRMNECVIALNGTGGCLSHVFANLSSLFLFENRKVILLGEDNIAFICWAGVTEINCRQSEGKVTYCSIIPMFGVVQSITTTGLKWNLDNSTLMFGKNGLISTSNEFTSDTVSIQTNVPVLFIVDLNHNRNADALVSSS